MEDLKRASAYSMLMAMYGNESDFHSLKDCFIPLVLQAFPSDGKATMLHIKSRMDSIYSMPELTLKTLLDRSIEIDFVEYDEAKQLYQIKSKIQNHFMDSVKDVDIRIQEMIKDVNQYFIDNGFVPSPDKRVISIILSFIDRSTIPLQLHSTAIKDMTHVTVETKGDGLLYDYIKGKLEKEKADIHLLTFLEMAKGAIIAEAIMWTDLKNIDLDKYRNCKIFIDTNVIFSLFKLHSESEYEAAKELLDLLNFFNFDLYIFDFTLQQIRAVLLSFTPEEAKMKSPDSVWGKFSSRAEARAKAEDIEEILEQEMMINVFQTEIKVESGNLPDDPEIRKMLAIYGKNFEQRKDYPEESLAFGKIHDFSAISKVKKLRGDEDITIYNPVAIFLTSDRKLADFNRLDMNSNNNSIPEVLLDTQMAGMLWFLVRDKDKHELKLSPNMILAAYSRNLLIDEEIWKKASDILEKVLKQKHKDIRNLPHIFYLDYQSMLSNCKNAADISIALINERIDAAYEIQNRINAKKAELLSKLKVQIKTNHTLANTNKEIIEGLENLRKKLGSSEIKRRNDRCFLWLIIFILIIGMVFLFVRLNGQ